MPNKDAHPIRLKGLLIRNEYNFRHMFVSRPHGGGVFRLATDCSCYSSACKEDKRNGDTGLCTPSRGSMVSWIYFNWNADELRSACSGLCDIAGNVVLKSEVCTWQ